MKIIPIIDFLTIELKKLFNKYKFLVISYCIFQNFKAKKRLQSGFFETASGNHDKMSVDENINYISSVFHDYLYYGDIMPDFIKEKSVLEVGPGDNLGVALKFLINGAKKVVCLDRYYSIRDEKKVYKIYKSLRDASTNSHKKIFDTVIALRSDNTYEINSEKLQYICGIGIEEVSTIFQTLNFDLIVSRAVLEHVYNPELALVSMNKIMNESGYQLHKVDLRDHGLFTGGGMHPLSFLTISDTVWKLMTYYLGAPNRCLIDWYRNKTKELGLKSRFFICSLLGTDEMITPHKNVENVSNRLTKESIALISRIKPKLIKRYRHMHDKDLIVSGFFLVAQKT